MGLKTGGVGHFQIPSAPGAGVSVVSGAANNYTGTAIVLSASTGAIYITGVHVETSAALAATYITVGLMIGSGGAETFIGQYLVPLSTGSTVALGFHPIYPPIPVANATRLTCKMADSVGSKTYLVSVEAILQTNVVDDGIAQTANVTQWSGTNVSAPATAGIPEVNVKNINNVGAATPGAAGGVLISGSNSGTTTLGALTITGATTHTGNVVLSDGLTISAPSTGNRAGLDIAGNGTGAALKLVAGATGIGMSVAGGGTSGDGVKVTTTSGHGVNLAPVGTSMHGFLSTGGNGGTSDGIKAAAGTGGVDFRANQTGNLTGNVSGSVGSVTGAVGSVTGLTASNLDTTVSSRLASGSYTAPSNLTAAQIATGVWQDTTATDFTTALSVGKSVMNGVALGTGLTVNAVTAAVTVGTNNDKTGYSLSQTFPANFSSLAITAGGAVTAGTVSDKSGYSLTVAPLTAADTRAAVGLASANLDTQIGTLATSAALALVQTDTTAIKAKTASLNFTAPSLLNCNVSAVRGASVATGSGTEADPWGP